MNKRINHACYPDWCKIYTFEGGTQFREGEEKVLYEGECVKYGSSQMRKFVHDNVTKADFCVDIPYVIKDVYTGMQLDVEDAQGKFSKCIVVVAFADTTFKLGTTVFFNVSMN